MEVSVWGFERSHLGPLWTCVKAGDNITGVDTPFHEQVRDLLAPIVGTLDEVAAAAVMSAEETATGLELPQTNIYRPTRVHLARALMRHQLERAGLDDWVVDSRQTLNTPLHLRSGDYTLRFLHTGPFMPAPGANRARQRWFANPRLPLDDALFEEPVNLLLLWQADFKAGLVSMRAVHPIGVWKYGGKVKIDLSIPLDDESFFDEDLAFNTRDEEDLQLPGTTEAAEEPEEGIGGVSS